MTVFEQAARWPQRRATLFNFVTCALIVVVSLLIYHRTWDYRYLDWDDNTLVEQNIYVTQPSVEHTLDMFVPGKVPGPHLPLRSASYVADFVVWPAIFGSGPIERPMADPNAAHMHHEVNTWLFILDGLLLFWICTKLLNPWAGAIAAMIWIAHPVHVEGVAWVSGRKEELSAALMFGCFLAYAYATEASKRRAKLPLWSWAGSLGLMGMATLVSLLWAEKLRFQGVEWTCGLISLALTLGAAVVYSLGAAKEKSWKVALLFCAAILFSLGAQLSKPVAIAMAPVLLMWEIGYRPRDEEAKKAAPADVLAPKPGLFDWLDLKLDEAIGMVTRLAPQIAVCLWSIYMTLFLAGKTQVLKDNKTWNAAPKNPLVVALSALWKDVYNLVAPLNLSSLYDVKSEWIQKGWWGLPWSPAIMGILVLIAIPALAIWLLRKSPKSLVWLGWWVFPIIPVSGIFAIAAPHADRYLFLPAIALAVALGVLLATAAFGSDEETGEWERWMAVGLSIAIVGGFSVLSYQRTDFWQKDSKLWGDAVQKNPDLPSARNNYGAALMNEGNMDGGEHGVVIPSSGALHEYYEAYRLLPSLDVAQFNIAATQMRRGYVDESVKFGELFVVQHPDMPTGWILMGSIYAGKARQVAQSNPAEAFQWQLKAHDAYSSGCHVSVEADQLLAVGDKANACNQLAIVDFTMSRNTNAEATTRRLQEMQAAFDEALKATPGNPTVIVNEARVQRELGDRQKSLALMDEAYRNNPGNPDVLRAYISLDVDAGRCEQANDLADALMENHDPRDQTVKQQIKEHCVDGVVGGATASTSQSHNATGSPSPAPKGTAKATPRATPIAASGPTH